MFAKHKYVAKAFVSVALCAAAVPALADVPVVASAGNGGASSYGQVAGSAPSSENYWTASSEYYVSTPGRATTNVTAPRRVMISGWHPVEGFEAEVAQEAANRAAHSARQ